MSSCSAHRNAVSKVAKGPPLIGAEAGRQSRSARGPNRHTDTRARGARISLDLLPSGLYRRLRSFTGSWPLKNSDKRSVTSDEQENLLSLATCHSSLLLGLAGSTADRELGACRPSPCPEGHSCFNRRSLAPSLGRHQHIQASFHAHWVTRPVSWLICPVASQRTPAGRAIFVASRSKKAVASCFSASNCS